MAVEAGAGRDQANPAGTRVHKMKKEKMVLKVALATKKILKTINYAEVQTLVTS